METILTVAEAATRLGLNVQTVYRHVGSGDIRRASTSGGPIMLATSSVDAFAARRRSEVVAQVGSLVGLAVQLHAAAWPVAVAASGLTVDGRDVNTGLPYKEPPPRTSTEAQSALRRSAHYEAGRAVFGAALDALPLPESDACRWCFGRGCAMTYGTPAPQPTAMWRALFGTNPCRSDHTAWKAAENAEKVARRARLAEMQQRARVTANARVSAAQQALRTEQTRAAKLTAAPGGRVALTTGGQGALRRDVRPEGLTAQELAVKARNRRRLNWNA